MLLLAAADGGVCLNDWWQEMTIATALMSSFSLAQEMPSLCILLATIWIFMTSEWSWLVIPSQSVAVKKRCRPPHFCWGRPAPLPARGTPEAASARWFSAVAMEIFCCSVQGPFEISSATAVATARSIPGADAKVAFRALTCA